MRKTIYALGISIIILFSLVNIYAFKPKEKVIAPMYYVDDYENLINIYTGNRKKLIYTTDIDIRTLTNQDKDYISSGLYLYNDIELNMLLEDLGS